jgi:hypothetical protein
MRKLLAVLVIGVFTLGMGELFGAEDVSLFTTETPEAEGNTTTPRNITEDVPIGEAYQVEIEDPAYVIPENATTTK